MQLIRLVCVLLLFVNVLGDLKDMIQFAKEKAGISSSKPAQSQQTAKHRGQQGCPANQCPCAYWKSGGCGASGSSVTSYPCEGGASDDARGTHCVSASSLDYCCRKRTPNARLPPSSEAPGPSRTRQAPRGLTANDFPQDVVDRTVNAKMRDKGCTAQAMQDPATRRECERFRQFLLNSGKPGAATQFTKQRRVSQASVYGDHVDENFIVWIGGLIAVAYMIWSFFGKKWRDDFQDGLLEEI